MKDKIEIGDTVKVCSLDNIYSTYGRMANALGSSGYVRGNKPSSMEFEVLNIGNHPHELCKVYLLGNNDGEFLFNNSGGAIEVIKKVKPTRTEYVNVENSIFDLKAEFEKGELYEKGSGYCKLISESDFAFAYRENAIYRKVEREITWQDELERLYPVDAISGHVSFKRLISDAEFIEMCHKVYHLTK